MIENLWIPPVGIIVHYTLPPTRHASIGEVRPAIVVRHMGADALALAVQYYHGDAAVFEQAPWPVRTVKASHSTKYAPGCWTPTPWAAPEGAGRCNILNLHWTACQLTHRHGPGNGDKCLFGEPLTGP